VLSSAQTPSDCCVTATTSCRCWRCVSTLCSNPEEDHWTTSGKITGGMSSFFSSTYTIGELIDIPIPEKLKITGFELSPIGIGVAAAVAIFAAWGYAYAEAIKNRNHQPNISQTQNGTSSHSTLTKTQRAALNCGFIHYTCDYFSSPALVINYIADKKNVLRSSAAAVIWKMVFLMLSGLVSVTEKRTWETNMHRANAGLAPANEDEQRNKKSDCWTRLNMVGELISGGIGNLYWIGNIVDSLIVSEIVGDIAIDDILGLSYYGFGFGMLGVLFAFGAAYCHYQVNKRYQHIERKSSNELANGVTPPLDCVEQMALAGDFFEHLGEVAGPLSLAITSIIFAAQARFTFWARLGMQLGTIAFAIPAAYTNMRTCRETLIRTKRDAQTTTYSQLATATELTSTTAAPAPV